MAEDKSQPKDAPKSQAKSATPEAKPAKFDPKPVNVGGESILERLLPHVKKIAIAAGIVIAIVMVAVIVAWFKEKKVIGATTKIVNVLDTSDREVRPPGTPAPKYQGMQSFGSASERANAVVDTIAKQGADKLPPAFHGAALVEAGKLDDAIRELRAGQTAPGLDGVLAREGLGMALEAKSQTEKDPAAQHKDLEDALAAFQAMQPDDKGPRRAYALYHQGRMLDVRLLNRPGEAKAAYQKAKDAAKDDPELVELIQERLASLGAS